MMLKQFQCILFIFLLFPALWSTAKEGPFTLRSKNITVQLNSQGKVTEIIYNKTNFHKRVLAYTEIESFERKHTNVTAAPDKKSFRFEHQLYSDSLKQSCTLIETFIATATSIRWNLEIAGNANTWGSTIRTVVKYPAEKDSRFWTTWGEPQFDSSNCDPQLIASLSPYKNLKSGKGWLDPLVPMPFSKHTLYYGAPPFVYEDIKPSFVPFQGNIFAIPFASIFETGRGNGLSIFLSPEDDIINLVMKTGNDGSIEFDRLNNRVSKDRPLKFSMDLVAHEADWRSALNWFATRYRNYVKPENSTAGKLGGTAAYSNFFDDFDADKMKKMAFTVNWQASFDFPYMGMFLPPVKPEVSWERLGGGTVSIQQMDDYAKRMKQKGFYVLNYFNVTEFGTNFKYPAPLATVKADKELWKDGSNYLYSKFPQALLTVADKVNLLHGFDRKTVHGGPYYSWKDAVAMDCGDPAYQQFLLTQARRHIREIPNSFGICIDRLDWLRYFNEKADDGITWFDSRAARSLVTSWKGLMEKLGPLMHDAGKYILVNNHYKRIDLLKHADGILDEFTNATSPLNTTAFLTIGKPALGWTPGKESIDAAGGDNFFQKYLYLGVFPMCPFPGNDHALQPDSAVDKLYLDYGPLMQQLKEKEWVLTPGIIGVKQSRAKVNLFKTKNGYSIPVVYGDDSTVTVVIHDAVMAQKNFRYRVYLPGQATAVTVPFHKTATTVEISVPLKRGAAMLIASQ